jgi:hypothetical protein
MKIISESGLINPFKIILIPALVFIASSLRRNPFIGCATIELQFKFPDRK